MKISARQKRLVTWGIATLALVLVARAVPVRDRCNDPSAGTLEKAPRVAVSRESGACIIHRDTGLERIDAASCARLSCEPGIASTASRARGDVLAALFALYLLGTLVWSARWRMLLGLGGVRLSLLGVWRVSLEAQAGGVLLPGGVGGDALRIATAASLGAPLSIAVASVMLDRLVGLTTLASVALALTLAFGGGGSGIVTLAFAAVPVGFALGLLLVRSSFFADRPDALGRTLAPVVTYLRDPRAPNVVGSALLVSLVISAIQLTIMRGLVFALGGAPTSEAWIHVGSTIAFVAGALPALPGGWGTSDAAFVFFVAQVGIPAAIALGATVAYRAFWYVTGVAGSLLLLARRFGRTEQTPGPI